MPKWLICIPLAVQWLWLAVRYRSTTLPSAANPCITAGGLVGEGKLEYFKDMGARARAATATYCSVRTDLVPCPVDVLQIMAKAGLEFPVIAKPDLGLCGYGVQKIDDLAALMRYLEAFPRNEVVVLQEYLSDEGEAGIFYARDPETDQSHLLGVALRYYPRVIGDGVRSTAALIDADPRARRLRDAPHHAAACDLLHIPARDEVVRLATIGSTRVGGLYRNGAPAYRHN
ncbi:D-alanine-D-alanine ligase [Oxalobacteraceae bacterium IMCC9480]|nr:D-alanine-D-alanine ligase [Oxalobacteraceae bacterium IMCC9480]